MKYITFKIRLLLLLSMGFLANLFSQELPVLSGCEYSYPPYCMVNDAGDAIGFSVELLRASLDVMGRDVQFKVDTWDVLKNDLALGNIEALPLVGRTPEREAMYDFTFPYLKMHGTIVVLKDSPQPRSLEDMQGKTIGVMKGDNAEEYLQNQSTPLKIYRTDTFEEALAALSRGEIDGVVIQRLLALQLVEQMGVDNLTVPSMILDDFSQSFCFAVTKGNQELLSLLNEGLATIISNGNFNRIQSNWFDPDGALKNSERTILVGGDKDYPPYEYLDERGMPRGFNVELTQAIAREMGLNVEIQLGAWKDVYKDLERGNLDLIEGMFYSEDRAEVFSFSQPYTVIKHVVISREPNLSFNSYESFLDKNILVMEGDIMHEYVLEQNLGMNVIAVKSLEMALQRLSDGEGDCVLGAQIPSLFYIEKHHLDNLFVKNQSFLSPEYNYSALHKNYILIQQFSQGLSAVKESGEYREIYSRWLDAYENQILDIREIIKIGIFTGTPLILIIAIILLWNLSLKKSVRQRTMELQETAELLSQHEQAFSFILENVIAGYWDWDFTADIMLYSPAFKELFGYSETEWTNRPESWKQFIIPEYIDKVNENLEQHWNSRGLIPFRQEVAYRHKNGDMVHVLTAGQVVKWSDSGKPLRMLGCHIDITPLKQSEASKNRLLMAVDQLTEGIIITQLDGTILYVNSAVEKQSGYKRSELEGHSPAIFKSSKQSDGFYKDLWDTLKKGSLWSSAMVNKRKDGSFYSIQMLIAPVKDSFGKVVNYIAIQRDITKEQAMEKKLLRKEKMESLGFLAGGIAHDFNNILGAIIGFTELSQDIAGDSEELHHYLDMILSSGLRAKNLVSQILTFSHKNKTHREPLYLKKQIDDILKMMNSIIPASIKLQYKSNREMGPVMADPSRLSEILVNLCNNAVQAMDNKGSLIIESGSLIVENELIGVLDNTPAGAYSYLSVKDSGKGLSQQDIAHIFDPFYTTKTMGQGTGMGLAVVYGLVKEFSGNILVESQLKEGTNITLYFPVSEKK